MSPKAIFALTALSSLLAVFCEAAADISKPPIKFCKKSPCPAASCPVSVTTDDATAPNCKIYNTKTVLGGHGFKGTSGGETMVFADIAQPAAGCQTIVRSPAAVDKPGCGVVIGDFHQSACVSLAFHKTFMLQKQCNGKMIRGMDWKRSSDGFGALTLTFENGTTIEPLETGEPPELQERDASADDDTFLLDAPMLEDRDADPSETDTDSEYHVNNLFTRQHSKSCKGWKPKSAALSDYTKSAGHTQIVATNVDGGKQGATVQISKARTASESISMTAGVNLEVVEASTTITFEKSTTDTKTFTFNIPAGQLGNVGFTPTLRCSTGTCKGSGSHGTVCTGFHQGGAIAGTYAVIAES